MPFEREVPAALVAKGCHVCLVLSVLLSSIFWVLYDLSRPLGIHCRMICSSLLGAGEQNGMRERRKHRRQVMSSSRTVLQPFSQMIHSMRKTVSSLLAVRASADWRGLGELSKT